MLHIMRNVQFVVALLLAIGVNVGRTQTVLDIVSREVNLETLERMIFGAGLDNEMNSTGPVTLFAPGIFAYVRAQDNLILTLLDDPTGYFLHLRSIVDHITANGDILASSLTPGVTITTRSGGNLTAGVDRGDTILSNAQGETARVVTPDIVATNGIIHTISDALLPAWASADLLDIAPSLYRTFAVRAGLEDLLRAGNLTVVMPSTLAFIDVPSVFVENVDLLEQLLKNHIVKGVFPTTALKNGKYKTVGGPSLSVMVSADGSEISFNGARAVQINQLAKNGIAYTIDTVITALSDAPTVSPTETFEPTVSPTPLFWNLKSLISRENDISRFEASIIAAGLQQTIHDLPGATIFAPRDSAIGTEDFILLTRLLQPQWIAHLRDLVELHMTGSVYYASNLTSQSELSMLNFEMISVFTGPGDSVFLSNQKTASMTTVSDSDQSASNGVLHKLNGVLLPFFATNNLIDVLTADDSFFFSSFLSWVAIADLEDVLRSNQYTVLAPTNTAVFRLPNETQDELSDPANADQLRRLLEYHILPRVLPLELARRGTYATLNGAKILFSSCACGIGFQFNDVPISGSDILANNGIIYAMDGILRIVDATSFPTTSPTLPQPTRQPVPTPPGVTPTDGSPFAPSPTGLQTDTLPPVPSATATSASSRKLSAASFDVSIAVLAALFVTAL